MWATGSIYTLISFYTKYIIEFSSSNYVNISYKIDTQSDSESFDLIRRYGFINIELDMSKM